MESDGGGNAMSSPGVTLVHTVFLGGSNVFERFTDRARRVVVLAQEEARLLNHNYIGTEHILLGLIREGEGVAAQVLVGLGADLNRVRQQTITLLHGYQGEGEPGTIRAVRRSGKAGRGKRKLLSQLLDRLDLIESRVWVLENRVGTEPDVRDLDQQIAQIRHDKESAIDAQDFEHAAALRDREKQLHGEKASRQQEWATTHRDLPSLADQIEHLRGLLRQHGIEPNDGAPSQDSTRPASKVLTTPTPAIARSVRMARIN